MTAIKPIYGKYTNETAVRLIRKSNMATILRRKISFEICLKSNHLTHTEETHKHVLCTVILLQIQNMPSYHMVSSSRVFSYQ